MSRAFAVYIGRSYCVACSHGSAALSIALQALDVGPGDEVILTGLTWVACPAAIARLGARPILVDINSGDLCASVSAIERAVTPKTRAILMIHMYSSICDVAAYLALAKRHRIALVEDASQAHGASWHGSRIGSFGAISVFSTQQSKLLTSGEGGLCVTDDPMLYAKLQQLRADGRQYRVAPFHMPADNGDVEQSHAIDARRDIAPDGYELKAAGDVAGQNLCLTEFQSALLLEGLDRLDHENAHRRVCVDTLATSLASAEGVELIVPGADVDRPTFYRLAMRVDRSAFAGLSAHQLVPALAAELSVDVRRVDAPLNAHPLYVPTRAPVASRSAEVRDALEPSRFDLPCAAQAYAEVITFPHQMLLSAPEDMQDVAKALEKVRRCAPALKARTRELTLHEEV
jgi:dTDP-4-amino-4,6-dideoxygalactose transaminase